MVDSKLARILKRKRLERRQKRKEQAEAKRIRPGHTTAWIEARPSEAAAKAMKKAASSSVADQIESASGSFEVCLKYVPYDAKEEEMKEFFSECGEIDGRVRLLRDRETGKCKGIGWVTFTTAEGMANAISNDGCEYGGRHLSITAGTTQWRTRWDQPKPLKPGEAGAAAQQPQEPLGFKVCLKYLPGSTQDDELAAWLEGKAGALAAPLTLLRAKDGAKKCKGMGWASFATEEARDKAVALDGSEYGGKKLSITVATSGAVGGAAAAAPTAAATARHAAAAAPAGQAMRAAAPAAVAQPSGYKACIKYLPPSTQDAELKAFFERMAGPVVGTPQVMRAPNGKAKGMAWVVFQDKQGLQRAVEREETVYSGKKIAVSEATTKAA